MKFVVDKNIPLVEKAFGSLGEVTMINTGEFTNESVREADVLVVRSETKVNKSLLEGSHVKFVGTATIGMDHIDLDYLASEGIAFTSAPGCNSNSVKEYITSVLLYLANANGFSLQGKTIGVVGVGNVGSKVVKVAETLGMTVLQNDPPLERKTAEKKFVSLDELMSADFLTLHVPLTRTGPDATYHLFNNDRFNKLRQGTIFINTSRGAVVETKSLKQAITERRLPFTVIDVWENEPNIDQEILSMVTVGTPHIAGYSIEGKINAVRMVREAFCKQYKIDSSWDPTQELSPPLVRDISVSSDPLSAEEIFYRVIRQCYDIIFDDKQLRSMLKTEDVERGKFFKNLRTGYRIRREFSNVTVHISPRLASLRDKFVALGFKCSINP
jgi:erythronate-4-phosphate dehydrogenase